MFDQTFTLDAGTRRPWTVFAGLSGQLFALGLAMLVPLVYTDNLPLFRVTGLHILPPISRPMAPPELARTPRQTPAARPIFNPGAFYAPSHVPNRVAQIVDPPDYFASAPIGSVVGGTTDIQGAATGVLSSYGVVPLPPPPPPAHAVEAPKVTPPSAPTRVSQGVQEAKIIRRVMPIYPQLARQARVSGTVELVGVIAKDGTVRQLNVISGHPLLIPAAVDAVKQWTYRPTLLSGEPVEVVAPITVHFILGQ